MGSLFYACIMAIANRPALIHHPSNPSDLASYTCRCAQQVKELYVKWSGPMDALAKAGRAFDGLEALLGGAGFDLSGNIWKRQVSVAKQVASGHKGTCFRSQRDMNVFVGSSS